jgi:hypothetical protein
VAATCRGGRLDAALGANHAQGVRSRGQRGSSGTSIRCWILPDQISEIGRKRLRVALHELETAAAGNLHVYRRWTARGSSGPRGSVAESHRTSSEFVTERSIRSVRKGCDYKRNCPGLGPISFLIDKMTPLPTSRYFRQRTTILPVH